MASVLRSVVSFLFSVSRDLFPSPQEECYTAEVRNKTKQKETKHSTTMTHYKKLTNVENLSFFLEIQQTGSIADLWESHSVTYTVKLSSKEYLLPVDKM